MPPLSKAIATTGGKHSESEGGHLVSGSYTGIVDSDWTIFAVPNGGYILSLLVNACIQYQSTTQHRDPIHVSAHFLGPSASAPFTVEIQNAKTGKAFTNITAQFIQKKQTKFVAHLIFGTLALPGFAPGFTLMPDSPYARHLSLYDHPSISNKVVQYPPQFNNFKHLIEITTDPFLLAKNLNIEQRKDYVGGQGIEWGGWFQLVGEDEKITLETITLFVDMFPNFFTILPRDASSGFGESWFPTLTLAVEYKSAIPTDTEKYSTRTVGLYSSTKLVNDSRFDITVEVWTAPSDIGKGKMEEGWREKQICLAVSSHFCLVVPGFMNTRNATSSKL